MPSLSRLSRSNTQATGVQSSELEQANTKRRKSSVSSLKAIPLSFRSKRKGPGMPVIHTEYPQNDASLASLPTELQLQVLHHLSFTDLCSLRATSKDFNHFITGPDSAIARYWISSKLHRVHRLYPITSQDHWQHLTSQMHRWAVARHLAETIAYHIQYKTLLYVHRQSSSNVLSASILAALLLPEAHSTNTKYTSAEKQLRHSPVAARITRRMTPLLFTLSHYLSSCQQSLSASQMAYSLSGEPTTFWTCVESSERFSCYTRDQLFHAHYCWLFLEWVFKIVLSRPTYAGSIERAMRGWTAAPLDTAALAQVLVHGNLTAVKQILRLKDYGERKKWAKNFLRDLDPEQDSIGWSDAWQGLDLRHGDVPSKAQATAILRGPEKGESLWTHGARKRLSSLGIDLEENELHGNAATTMHFLTELAGFDLFNEQPPSDMDEDDSDLGEDVHESAESLRDDDEHSADQREILEELLESDGANYWDR